MNSKAFFVIIAFVMVFAVMTGGALGSTDLTPDTPKASNNQVQVQPMVGGVSTGLCASPYTVQTGDTLSTIARRCGVELNDLVAANPSITNPNFISVGQMLAMPGSVATPTAPVPTATPEPTSTPIPGVPPGSSLTVEIINMPPNTSVKLAVGVAGAPYVIIGESLTDESGNLKVGIVIPEHAIPGENWTVTAITSTEPPQEFTSQPIAIGSKP